MRNTTSARIVRRENPPPMQGRVGYRKAEPHLRRDFDYRCAYCMVHEGRIGGTRAFCIDHFKPKAKGGRVNDYANLYWACLSCNAIKHDKWPTAAQHRRGYRLADPCREQDYGVHIVESDDGRLQPLTPCGEYHLITMRLNRAWLLHLRLERNRKQARLNEALALQVELQRALLAQPQNTMTQMNRRLLSFLHQEIAVLQRELAIAIPLIPRQDGAQPDD